MNKIKAQKKYRKDTGKCGEAYPSTDYEDGFCHLEAPHNQDHEAYVTTYNGDSELVSWPSIYSMLDG